MPKRQRQLTQESWSKKSTKNRPKPMMMKSVVVRKRKRGSLVSNLEEIDELSGKLIKGKTKEDVEMLEETKNEKKKHDDSSSLVEELEEIKDLLTRLRRRRRRLPQSATNKNASNSNNNDNEQQNEVQEKKVNLRRGRSSSSKKKNDETDEDDDDDDNNTDDDDDDEVNINKNNKSLRKRKQVNYKEVEVIEDDEDYSSSEEEGDDDDDNNTDDDSDKESDYSMEDAEDDDSSSEEYYTDDDEVNTINKNNKKKKSVTVTKKKKTKDNLDDDDDDDDDDKKKKTDKKERTSMAEKFEPTNNPVYWKFSSEEIKKSMLFLDPCGMEATDDIIGAILGKQVEKIGSLLMRALSHNNNKNDSSPIGSKANPLRLGTACSGTDAPALAMGIIQEQLKLRGCDDLFHFDHKYSCENEPFKQSYIARNFDSLLYPDIGKLANEKPHDVYGRQIDVPDTNTFVAGTSCKNFSMLMSKFRLDIEEKGCSGETFLAAVEVIFKQKQDIVLFENVSTAPWDKMKEYVTGRIDLSKYDENNNKKKTVGTKKSKKSGFGHFKFQQNSEKNNNIIVVSTPDDMGVRPGTALRGFIRKGESLTDLKKAKWPTKPSKNKSAKKNNGECSLLDLIESNKGMDTSRLIFDTPVTYCCHHVNVDSKDFGVPQTRNRTYMFVWQPKDGNIEDDLGKYFEDIVEHLKSPIKHSLEAFLLEVDHDNIRILREALRGPPGRETKRQIDQEKDFWTSTSANLKHNTICRDRSGIDDTARYITRWGPRGEKHPPPHYWQEYLNMQHQRENDMIDILHASSARDAESHDSNHTSFAWNISQNVSKEKHRSKTPGITSCITPGGDLFLPHLGRPILGCEKLLLQGIPYFLLELGNETEVQLSDLAGNAMTLSVVSATILAALTCKQLQRETSKNKKRSNPWQKVNNKSVTTVLKEAKLDVQVEKPLTLLPEAECNNAGSINSLLKDLVLLSPSAVHSSIFCTCETSGQNTTASEFYQCKICRIKCCVNCLQSHSGYQLHSHDIIPQKIKCVESRNLTNFENKLRSLLPSTIFFTKETFETLSKKNHEFQVDERQPFILHRIRRHRRYWLVIYYVRDKLDQAIAELTIRVGEVSTQILEDDAEDEEEMDQENKDELLSDEKANQFGVVAFLKSFLHAREEPFEYGPLDPCAKIQLLHNDNEQAHHGSVTWEILERNSMEISLNITGSDPTESYRRRVGLNGVAEESIHTKISNSTSRAIKQHSKTSTDRRRYYYASNWKEWPKVIEITRDESNLSGKEEEVASLLEGTYISVECEHTINQNALWIRKSSGEKPTLYLLLKPDVARTGPDVGIISTSVSYEDTTHILAYLPSSWQPCDALIPKCHHVKKIQCPTWSDESSLDGCIPNSSVKVRKPDGKTKNTSKNNNCVLLQVCGLCEAEMKMLSRGFHPDKNGIVSLQLSHSQQAQQSLRAFNSICAAPILKFAASSDLKDLLSPQAKWIDLTKISNSFGQCERTIPYRPIEEWFFDEERNNWYRRGQPEASRKYCEALEKAPQVFDFHLSEKEGILSLGINPEVAAHNAARYIIEGREKEVRENLVVEYRLSSLQGQLDPSHDRFKVKNCKNEVPLNIPLKEPFELYERQQRVLSKMMQIEERKTEYEEVEMSQHVMPGSIDWSVVARVSRTAKIRGGVICDAIGAGKTVVSIALILNGISNAKANCQRPFKSQASLIVVPDGLIGQWESEIKKFSNLNNVVCIHDTQKLLQKTLKDILEADCVIIPIDLLESNGYLKNLDKMSSCNQKRSSPELPKLPSHDGTRERSGAKGVWLAATSNNPYGGGNTPKSQSYRNQSARYSYEYQRMIDLLRQQKFKDKTKGVPIEYFEFERIFVDEIHESLVTKDEVNEDKKTRVETGTGYFREKNRRAGRELLGLMTKDINKRPLRFRQGIFGLTGTPLLDNSDRVIELANLMGICYVLGLSSHWRKLEKESSRDIFLHNFLEPKKSREIRDNMYKRCQAFLDTACCRNKADKEMMGIKKIESRVDICMSTKDEELYLSSQNGIPKHQRSLGIGVADFDPTAGHDVSVFLRQNAKLQSRGDALAKLCKQILKKDSKTKIIVFCDGSVGGGVAARKFLDAQDDLKCTLLEKSDSVEEKNRKISWYQKADQTVEDRKRPRILVLNFEHAAGLNLQYECYNVILFNPLYTGEGASTGNAVNDASTELQAIGRVYRPGQPKEEVFVYRLEVKGPNGEECLDGQLIDRNTDEATIEAATNSSE